MANRDYQRNIQGYLLDYLGTSGYGNRADNRTDRNPIMRICIECNYIGASTEGEYYLCPRCYSGYRVAKMLNLRQLSASARAWERIMPIFAEQRRQQYTILQQHMVQKNERPNQSE